MMTLYVTASQYLTIRDAIGDGIDFCTDAVSLAPSASVEEEWINTRDRYEALESFLETQIPYASAQ